MSAHDDLVLLALGQLPPREREALTARLKQDPALAREAEEVARHLALYERLPAPPPPPPFAALAPRLGAQQGRRFPWLLAGCATAAALALFLGVEARVVSGPDPLRWSAPLRASVATERVLKEGRVRVVLDAGAVLRDGPGPLVALDAGRAWFEVQPGTFVVQTPHGQVTVLGTAFEVEVGASLRVEVAEGRVQTEEHVVDAGWGLEGDRRYALGARPARFARLADMRVGTPLLTPTGLALTVAFENRADFARDVPGPQVAAAGLWLAFEGPNRTTHGQAVDVLAAAGGRLPAAGRVKLAPGERLEVSLVVPLPPGPAGSWRLTALYRPEGETPISSAPVTFEVPPR